MTFATQSPEFLAAIGVALLGFAAGVVVFLAPSWKLLPAQELYVNRRFLIWLFLACAQVGLWFVIAGPLIRPFLAAFKQQTTAVRWELLLAAVFVGTLLFGPRLVTPWFIGPNQGYDDYVPGHDWRIGAATILGFLFALPAIAGIWLIHGAARNTPRPNEPLGQQIQVLLKLRSDLQNYLSVVGAMVAAATVSDGALRLFQNAATAELLAKADAAALAAKDLAAATTDAAREAAQRVAAARVVAPTDIKPDDLRLIPPESTILYGLFFTLLLALIYVPAYLRLVSASQRIVDAVHPLPDPEDATWATQYQQRKSLAEYLNLNAAPLENVRASIVILAPFVGSILGVSLPKG